MMRSHLLLPILGLVGCSLIATACTESGDAGGDGGAAGEAPSRGGSASGSGGTSGGVGAGPAGAGEAGAGDAGAGGDCTTDGAGTLVIEVTGLPTGVAPDIDISGPEDLNATEDGPLEGVAAGTYTVQVNRVFDEDPIVRTVFAGKVTAPSLCLRSGASKTIKVEYTAIPTSNKLWLPTAQDNEGAAFASSQLGASGTKLPAVSIDGGIGKSIAFDRDGNLWTLGPTLDFPQVLRFSAASLAASGAAEPDISFNVPEVECLPAMRALALDPDGNLWLSACGDSLYRIAATDLSGVGEEKVADALIAGVSDNEGMAFDRAGNLWVAAAGAILRYDAARLAGSTGDEADLSLTVQDELAPLRASFLTFDKAGNLWGTDFAANAVFQVAEADLQGVGAQNADANVSITLAVDALLSQPAFDDGNGLWLGLEAGRIGRLSPAQLGMSAGAGMPATPSVLIKSTSIDSELPVAFFPAPRGLPLFHSIPEE